MITETVSIVVEPSYKSLADSLGVNQLHTFN